RSDQGGRLGARGVDRRLGEVDADHVLGAALLGEPARDAPGAAPHVDDAMTGDAAERARDDRALPVVPEGVVDVGGPERASHAAPGRGARVPVRGNAVDRVARPTLFDELPDARPSGAVRALR